MRYTCTTKKEIREALVRREVNSVEFGDWDGTNGGDGETRSIALHTALGSIIISATSYGTLRIEQS